MEGYKMVAPTYQKYFMMSEEPYAKNDKLYVRVRSKKTGNIKEVRWYNENEYKQKYENIEKIKKEKKIPFYKTIEKEFSCGSILLFRDVKDEDARYAGLSYRKELGWYLASYQNFPVSLEGKQLKMILLPFAEIRKNNAVELLIAEKEKNNKYFNFV